jgi:hypothetical protein
VDPETAADTRSTIAESVNRNMRDLPPEDLFIVW